MTHDVGVLINWIEVCLIIAAVSTTTFPLLYAFSPWYKYRAGQALMLQSIAFALALDVTALFRFWTPGDIMIRFWINAFIFSIIAATSAFMTFRLWQFNYRPNKEKETYGAAPRRRVG